MMAGQDLSSLCGELKKLAAYTEDHPEITPDDVHAVVSPSPEYSVFMILDHLLEGRLAEASKVVSSVLQTEPSVIRLISMLENQLRINAHMKYAIEGGGSLPQTLKALNITEYRARHIRRQIQGISAAELLLRYQHCIDADYDIKSGRVKDRAALDALLLKISLPKKATK